MSSQTPVSARTRSASVSQVTEKDRVSMVFTGERSSFEADLNTIEENLNSEDDDTVNQALKQLATLVKEADFISIQKYFRRVLIVLLPLASQIREKCRKTYLSVLREILGKRSISSNLQAYIKLILKSVFKIYSGEGYLKIEYEPCLEEIAASLNPDTIAEVLSLVVTSKSFPDNFSAIKTLEKVVVAQSKQSVTKMFSQILTVLIRAYVRSDERLVQMSAIMCMVKLCDKMGGYSFVRRSHLSGIELSKLRLLEVYIKGKTCHKM